jgi:hypothetical protein
VDHPAALWPRSAALAYHQRRVGNPYLQQQRLGRHFDHHQQRYAAIQRREWLDGFSVAGTFEGEFSSNVTSYAGKGVVKYSW